MDTTLPPTSSAQTPPTPVPSAVNDGMTEDTKSALVAVLLVWFYPIGVIFMFVWAKQWPTWAKVIILLPMIFGVLILGLMFTVFGALFSSAMNSEEGFMGNIIQCTQQCESVADQESCMTQCMDLPENMDYEVDIDSNSTDFDDSETQIPSERSLQ
ncbi:hypothetical protein HY469_05450 [Candidatus Roizmanbacteria bacterium]|nr:hypothetical protein [Candidatus Roizmanbacteria bacterium]